MSNIALLHMQKTGDLAQAEQWLLRAMAPPAPPKLMPGLKLNLAGLRMRQGRSSEAQLLLRQLDEELQNAQDLINMRLREEVKRYLQNPSQGQGQTL